MHLELWSHWGFKDENITYICKTNKEVQGGKPNVVKSLNKITALVEPQNIGNVST